MSRGTRAQLLKIRTGIESDFQSITNRLFVMSNLSAGRSKYIDESLPICIRNTELLKDLINDLFKDL